MSNIDNKTLRKLQLAELELLKEVDRICRKNNIRYSLDGGTLLGAVRHDGFIPWDDDADVVLLRKEYYKFYEACKTDLNTDKFFLQEFRTDPYYRWGFFKLRYKNTAYIPEGQDGEKWDQSICIDIFVYDQVPDNFFLRRVHLFMCYCIRKGLYSVLGKRNSDNLLLRLWYRMLNLVPRSFWIFCIENIADICNQNRHELARHMTYPYREACRYGLPRECFDEYVDKDFEGHIFKIFKNYDLYLTRLYGDYMTLPPMEQRKTRPVSKIVLPENFI